MSPYDFVSPEALLYVQQLCPFVRLVMLVPAGELVCGGTNYLLIS